MEQQKSLQCKPLSHQNLDELLQMLRKNPIQSWSELFLMNPIARHIKSGTVSNVGVFADAWPEYNVIVCTDSSTSEGRVVVHHRMSSQHDDRLVQGIFQIVGQLWQRDSTPFIIMHADLWLAKQIEDELQHSSEECHEGGRETHDRLPTVEYCYYGFCHTFYLPDSSLLTKDVPLICPGEYVLKKLEEHNVEVVAADWKYVKNVDRKHALFLDLIKKYHNVGLFPKLESGGVSECPIGWCLQWPEGHLAHLFVDEKHRRKGLAKILVRHICDSITKDGEIPVTVIDENNIVSISLFQSFGFVLLDKTISFVGLKL